MKQNMDEKVKQRLLKIFRLYNPINRTFHKEFSPSQNKKEYGEWKLICDFYSKK